MIAQVYDESKACVNPEENLVLRWAQLKKKWPELAVVIQQWHHLPDAMKAGIVAMVKASSVNASE